MEATGPPAGRARALPPGWEAPDTAVFAQLPCCTDEKGPETKRRRENPAERPRRSDPPAPQVCSWPGVSRCPEEGQQRSPPTSRDPSRGKGEL